jgi:NADH:ubiquinone oxidoreductase subunit E
MVTIAICVGSSCHLKGAYDIIHQCEETISKLGLRDQVELKGTFFNLLTAKGYSART